MVLFRYEARRTDGGSETGEVEAQSRGHALMLLRERGLLVDALAEARPPRPQAEGSWGQGPFYPWWPIPAGALANLFEHLGRLLGAGVTPYQALSDLDLEGRVGGRLRRVCREGATRLAQGGSLSNHLARYPRFFSPHIVAIMHAGEVAGTLPEACREIVTQYETEASVRRQMTFLVIYLTVNLLACVLVPSFPSILNHIKMDGATGGGFSFQTIMETLRPGLQWYGRHVVTRILPWVLVVWVSLKAGQVVLNLPGLRRARDWLLLYTPVVGAATRKAAVARFTRTLELLLRAAVPPDQAVCEAARATGNTLVAERVIGPAHALKSGGKLNDVFRASGIFSGSQVSFLATAEQTGTLDDALGQLAAKTREERESFLKIATRGGCVAGMLLAAVCVAYAAAVGYLNLYNTLFKIFEGPDWQP